MPPIIKTMAHIGKLTTQALFVALGFILCAINAPALAQSGSDQAQVSETAREERPDANTQIAQFTATILAAMDGGPRIWTSPDAVIPDFAGVNAALDGPEARALDLRVAIWGPANAGVDAEDVAASLGQSLHTTLIAIGPDAIGVYSATHDEAAVQAATNTISGQLASESNPSVIITTISKALVGGSASGEGLSIPILVGIGISVLAGGAWFVFGRGKGKGLGVILNQALSGRGGRDEDEDHHEADDLDDDFDDDLGEDAQDDKNPGPPRQVRKVDAEIIDIEPDASGPKPPVSTAAAYGKVAAKSRLEHIAQRIVVLSDQVVRTQDVALMGAFEQIADAYSQAKTDLDQAERPVDLINLDDTITALSEQLVVLERRIAP